MIAVTSITGWALAAFAIGVSFAMGIAFGAWLVRSVTKTLTKSEEEVKNHRQFVEGHLSRQADSIKLIAECMENREYREQNR